jgi:hypothetical protein
MAKRSYDLTSTTTPQAVSDYDHITLFNHVSVLNKSDGDVEIYFGDANTNTNLICPKNTLMVFDKFSFSGNAYYYNKSGSGGQVILTVWQDDEK